MMIDSVVRHDRVASAATRNTEEWTRRICGIIFATRLSALRPAARELIVAQQMSGGTPAQEITARVFSKQEEAG